MLYRIFKIKKELRKYIKYKGKKNVKIKGFRIIQIYANNKLIYANYIPKKRNLFDFIEFCEQQINFYA